MLLAENSRYGPLTKCCRLKDAEIDLAATLWLLLALARRWVWLKNNLCLSPAEPCGPAVPRLTVSASYFCSQSTAAGSGRDLSAHRAVQLRHTGHTHQTHLECLPALRRPSATSARVCPVMMDGCGCLLSRLNGASQAKVL